MRLTPPWGIAKTPHSNDPRTWTDTGMGWEPGAVVPWRWVMWSPGAYYPHQRLAAGVSLSRSVTWERDYNYNIWQGEPEAGEVYYHLLFWSIKQNEPTKTVETVRLQIYFDQLEIPGSTWGGQMPLYSPSPIQKFRIYPTPIYTPPAPGGGLLVPWVEVIPQQWDVPVTPGNIGPDI